MTIFLARWLRSLDGLQRCNCLEAYGFSCEKLDVTSFFAQVAYLSSLTVSDGMRNRTSNAVPTSLRHPSVFVPIAMLQSLLRGKETFEKKVHSRLKQKWPANWEPYLVTYFGSTSKVLDWKLLYSSGRLNSVFRFFHWCRNKYPPHEVRISVYTLFPQEVRIASCVDWHPP